MEILYLMFLYFENKLTLAFASFVADNTSTAAVCSPHNAVLAFLIHARHLGDSRTFAAISLCHTAIYGGHASRPRPEERSGSEEAIVCVEWLEGGRWRRRKSWGRK